MERCSITTMISILLFMMSCSKVDSLSCTVCNVTACAQPVCPAGVQLDACGCCPVCAKIKDEECHGPFGVFGRCADGLSCSFEDSPPDSLPFNRVGKCVCDDLQCDLTCTNGNVEGPNGCPICQCKFPKCSDVIRNFKKKKPKKKCEIKETIFCNRRCNKCCSHETTCKPKRFLKKLSDCETRSVISK